MKQLRRLLQVRLFYGLFYLSDGFLYIRNERSVAKVKKNDTDIN